MSSAEGEIDLPPGTFLLIRENGVDLHGQRTVVLDPMPTSDPNEPLNWSTIRKTVNYTLVMGMTIIVFTSLSIQQLFWQQMIVDLKASYSQLNQTMSVSYVGLALGCVFFIPLAKKYGRRPVYIASTALMLATTLWTSWLHTLAELYICNLLQGLAGATNEAIVEITIADLFFVHHRGSMNGLYMSMVMIGTFLTPMAAGAQATSQGWRKSYQTLGIFNALYFISFLCLYEETKYVPRSADTSPMAGIDEKLSVTGSDHHSMTMTDKQNTLIIASGHAHHGLNNNIPPSSWRKRLALTTPTPEPIWPYYHKPFNILFTFPTITFAALQYAASAVWLTIMESVFSLVFPHAPYNFNPAQIGFTSLGPFIGNLLGAVYGGVLGDWSIIYFSRRNEGFFEPEMRLYILHLPVLALASGLIMFGATVARGMHWIYPSIAGALFGFGLGSISDAVLTLVIDSYRDITGDAFTGITFFRNAVSIGIPFAITPWMQRNGLQNMFIACGFISLGITSLIVPMVLWGKDARRRLARRYRQLGEQEGHVASSETR